jgi:hypothetical protein
MARADIVVDFATLPPSTKLRGPNARLTLLFLPADRLHDGLRMNNRRDTVLRRMRRGQFSANAGLATRLAGSLALLAILNGCGSQQTARSTSLPAAPLPTYGLGDSYQFSDGSSNSVTAVEDDVIRWRGNDGSTYSTSRDVLLPRLAWTNGSERGDRRINGDPTQLFPLEAGKEVGFTATRNVRRSPRGRPVTVQEDWACGVFDPARVATKAGVFDTWRVTCTMRETPAVTSNGLIRRNFYYAPDIGFYVRMEEGFGDGPLQSADLSGYTSSDPIMASSALRQRCWTPGVPSNTAGAVTLPSAYVGRDASTPCTARGAATPRKSGTSSRWHPAGAARTDNGLTAPWGGFGI